MRLESSCRRADGVQRLTAGLRAACVRLASGWRVACERLASGWRAAGERLASGWRAAGERLASGWQRLQLARRTETQRTAHRYAQTAQRTARSQSCGLSTGTYGYQTRHTHGRYVPPPGLPGRRSASATLLLPHTEQTRVPGAGHAAWLRCLPLMSLMASVRRSLPTLTHMYTFGLSRVYYEYACMH